MPPDITKVKQVVLPEKKPFFLRVWTDFSEVKQLVLLFQILFCQSVCLPVVLFLKYFPTIGRLLSGKS